MSKNHIAIDLGAGSGRVIVGKISDNAKIELEELYRFSTQNVMLSNSLVTNIYRIYEEILKALKIYVEKYGDNLASIGVDTWATDFGILDDNGNLFSIPVFYRDKRTEGIEEIVNKTIGYERLYELTSGRKATNSTLHQVLALKKQDDISLKYGDKLLFLGDLLHYFLSGNKYSEYTVASYSQLYNMRKNDWEDEIFELFDIPKKIKPEVVYPGDKIGYIRPEIAELVGLKNQTQIVAPAVHDTSSAVLAVPADENWAFISSGTWSLVGLELDKPIINESTFRYDISNTGLAFDKTLFKKNIMGLWIIQQCKKGWEKTNKDLTFSKIAEEAGKAEPFVGFIDPDDDSFFCPDSMVMAILKYLEKTGQRKVNPNDVGQVSRIIYESLAMKYHYSLNMIKSAANSKVQKVHIIGGGSNIDMLNRFTASVTGLEVYAGPKEATAIGNIMLQAYSFKEVGTIEEVRKIVAKSFAIRKYKPINTEKWKTQYDRFLNICNLNMKSN